MDDDVEVVMAAYDLLTLKGFYGEDDWHKQGDTWAKRLDGAGLIPEAGRVVVRKTIVVDAA